VSEHPFLEAWATRDIDALGRCLAPNVILRSPMLSRPFEGWAEAVDLYEVLFRTFGSFEVTDRFASGSNAAFFWRADGGGRQIEGVDLVRTGADGKIYEITVMIRPLVDIGRFAAAVGPSMASRRGRLAAVLARLFTVPLQGFLRATDAISTRLAQPRRKV
jgi:hypothetical protein